MKKKIIQYRLALLACLAVFGMTSCSNWLEVKPKTEMEAEDLFSTEDGFKESLAGCYTIMTKSSLYGREMTFGLVDAIAQQWNISSTDNTNAYYDASRYDYEATTTKSMVDSIWISGYNMIANVNSILEYIDEKQDVFTGDNYEIIKGEALALRAYMHFDLLRLFGVNGTSTTTEDGIPYVTELTKNITRTVSPQQVIANAVDDLEEAIALLEVDPILTGRDVAGEDNGYLANRQYHLNYYAATALLARVQLYGGLMADARENAMTIIRAHENEGKFPWVEQDAVTGGSSISKDRVFSSELLFCLNMRKLANYIDGYFTSTQRPLKTRLSASELYPVPELRSELFETIDGNAEVPSKLRQMEAGTDSGTGQYEEPVRDRMPMIRMAEMYYIVAECDMATPEDALESLNKVLTGRGYMEENLLSTSTVSTSAAVLTEIQNEYQREFICEGQLFYFYKRQGVAEINGQQVKYQLPKPDDELEFGQ